MITLHNQFQISFKLGKYSDFILLDDLHRFIIEEYATGALPTFELGFVTKDENILALMNIGNSLVINIGIDNEMSDPITLYIVKVETSRSNYPFCDVYLSGVCHSNTYANKTKVRNINKTSALAIKEVVSSFKWHNKNNEVSSDSMVWRQCSVSDREFVQHLFLRSYIANSQMLMGIDTQGNFLLRDLKKILNRKDRDFTFKKSKTKEDNNKVLQYQGCLYSNISSYNSYVTTKDKTFKSIDLIQGTTADSSVTVKNYMSISPLSRDTSNKTQQVLPRFTNTSNKHANYESVYLKNLAQLNLLQGGIQTVECNNFYFPIKVLDLVYYESETISDKHISSPYESGTYLVSKVSRCIQNKVLTTTVTLCNEFMNDQKGALG
jgi:hypothetical protein